MGTHLFVDGYPLSTHPMRCTSSDDRHTKMSTSSHEVEETYRRRASHSGSWYTDDGSLLDRQLSGTEISVSFSE